jgi:D-ribulokinase
VLAGAAVTGAHPAEAADRMVRIVEVVDPDPAQVGPLDEGYQRLTDELRRRGWLDDGA